MGVNSRAALRGLTLGFAVGFCAANVKPYLKLPAPNHRAGSGARDESPLSPAGTRGPGTDFDFVLRAEKFIRLGDPDRAVRLITQLEADEPRSAPLDRIYAWALFSASKHRGAYEMLDCEGHLTSELRYLRGASKWRARHPGGLDDLRQLWWENPASVWGLAALRELATRNSLEGGPYSDSSRELILRRLPSPDLDSGLQATRFLETSLTEIADAHREPGLLSAELHHALGALRLQREQFTLAAESFRRALAQKPPRQLYRSIELHLAEALRHRGAYAFALKRFQNVARGANDALANRALFSSGEMAIQSRRYVQARERFETALLRNPVGGARHRALWGLGWVAFRTGDFLNAIRFFRSLKLEAPYGTFAPRALYWQARAQEERNQPELARNGMLEVTEQFPLDYYAHLAAAWLGARHLKDARYPDRLTDQHPRVAAAVGLYRARMPIRTTRAIEQSLTHLDDLGPHELLLLEFMAQKLEATRLVGRIKSARQLRFPRGKNARRAIRRQYPERSIQILSTRAKRQRIDASILVAIAKHESQFDPRMVSSVGEIGLFQLRPHDAATLMEESRRSLREPEMLMDEELNADLGSRYIGRILRAFGGRVAYALAAYDAGPGAVTRWRELQGDLPQDIFVEEIPYIGTRRYVREVLASQRAYQFAWSDAPLLELPNRFQQALATRFIEDVANSSVAQH